MKRSANRYERIAGLFVLLAVVLALLTVAGVVYEKGWLASKTSYHTYLKTATGIHRGTKVQIFGLQAGWVNKVELISAGKVKVTIDVMEKYQDYVTADSEIQVIRPFVVGEKVIELSIGNKDSVKIAEGSFIPYRSGIDVVDLLSGRLLGPLMNTLSSIADDMKMFTTSFTDKDIKTPLTRLVNELTPLIENMNDMSREVAKMTGGLNEQQKLLQTVESVADITEALNDIMPVIVESTPELAEKVPVLIKHLVEMSTEINKLTPAMAEITPQIPAATQRTIEAVEEAVVTMKALQKSFLLRGKVKKVREEIQARDAVQ